MAEQPELDLPTPPSVAAAAKPRGLFGGFSRMQLFVGLLIMLALVWGMWVTKALTAKREHIVSVRLADVVGEYVEMQRFSASPPDKVRAEMQVFMASLDKELQRRSGKGEVVLVGEAVLSKNVDDITDSVKKAVFDSGVPMPKRASAADLQRMQEMAAPPQQPPSAAGMPVQPIPVPAPQPGAAVPQGAFAMPTGNMPSAPQPGSPAASVSTFGGPDGVTGQ